MQKKKKRLKHRLKSVKLTFYIGILRRAETASAHIEPRRRTRINWHGFRIWTLVIALCSLF